MSNEIMVPEIQEMMEKGLTEVEATLVHNYKERGLPGISQLKSDVLMNLYIMGYSCQELAQQFPEYKLDMLLYARLKFEWDRKRFEYQQSLANHAQNAAMLFKAEAIRFLFDVQNAVHVKNRQEIMRYLAAPDREKPPEFLPKTLHQYLELAESIQEITTPKTGPNGQQSPAINMTVQGNVKITESTGKTPKEAGQILIDRMKAKKQNKT